MLPRVGTLGLCLLATAAPCAGQVVISEFMAANRSGLTDRDGYAGDWVELYNAGPEVAGLGGHYLSNDPARPNLWALPPTQVPAGGYVVVHLSGKDRKVAGQPLHASFRLDREGGELLWVDEDGRTPLSRVTFGAQHDDVSQGFSQDYRSVVLLSQDAQARYLIPDASTGADWVQPEFDDSGWTTGQGAFGYQRSKERTLSGVIGTDVGATMRGVRSSACYRFGFEVEPQAAFDLCVLRIRFEAGFVAWLNGVEIARRRAPRTPAFDSAAIVGIEPRDPELSEYFEIEGARELLRPGHNVLAVQGLVESANSLEHLVLVEVSGYTTSGPPGGELVYFETASPGRPNGLGSSAVAPPPTISSSGGLLEGPTRVTLTSADPRATIRYTLDGSQPQPGSAPYQGPLSIERSAALRARAFVDGATPSTSAFAGFSAIDPSLRAFSSDLPVLVISTFGGTIRAKSFVDAHVHVLAPGPDGRTTLLDAPEYSAAGAIKMRGSSTLGRPKKSYGLELRDQAGRDRPAGLLGMPPDADWVLYGPHNWDQSHIRNALCLELARGMGLLAPRLRFVEVFVNDEARELRPEDHVGLYVLMERISQGPHRVDVEELRPKHDREPAVTGGYILKIDRPGPGDMGFTAGGQRLQFVYPKENEISASQRAWLQRYFSDFNRVLKGPQVSAPDVGYAAWIDVDNWIDFHFFHEFTRNPDAFTLSTYLHKRRSGKIRMGPVWDFDRAMRTNDDEYWVGKPSSPYDWTSDRLYGWWGSLFADEGFALRYRRRSRELLRNELSLERVHAEIDRMAAEVAEAEERDRLRWPIIAPGAWLNEIKELKAWIAARHQWLRSELLEKPVFASSTDSFEAPFTLEITHANDTGTLYYTLDGSDPSLMDGSLSPLAVPYAGPVAIAGPTRARARVLVEEVWSTLTEALFSVPTPTLTVSEVMYNPESGGDYEFVELENSGSAPLDLTGIELDGPLRFHFSLGDVKRLGPGQRVVVVRNRHEFQDRYDISGMLLAGEYFGRFSNTAADFTVKGPYGQVIARVHYEDAWFPGTDGQGYSLVAREPTAELLEEKQWMQSETKGGTPGH